MKKVYVCDATASDLLVMGGLEARLENGVVVDPGFCARVVLDDSQGDDPLFVLFQGWTVGECAPVARQTTNVGTGYRPVA